MRINSIPAYSIRSNVYNKKTSQTQVQPASVQKPAGQNLNFGWISGTHAENAMLMLKNPNFPDNKREVFGEKCIDQFEILKSTCVLDFEFDIDKNKDIKFGEPCRLDVTFMPIYLKDKTDDEVKYQDKVIKKMFKSFNIKPGKNEILGDFDTLEGLGDFVEKHVWGHTDPGFGFSNNDRWSVMALEKEYPILRKEGRYVWRQRNIPIPYYPDVYYDENGKVVIDKTHAYDLPEGYKLIERKGSKIKGGKIKL